MYQAMLNKTVATKRDSSPKVSPQAFAEHYGISRMTVYRMIQDNQIAGAVKVRGQWRLPLDALDG